MRKLTLALAVAASSLLGAVGCDANKSRSDSTAAVAALEARVTKLEKDLHAAEAARDAALVKLQTSQMTGRDLESRVEAGVTKSGLLAKECNMLKSQLATRTAEKEQLTQNLDSFRKGLRELLGQADTAAGVAPGVGAVSAAR